MERPAVSDFVRLLIGVLCLQALWALTNPIFASPDETAHIARAQSFASLDFSPPYTTDGLPLEQVDCFRFFGNNPATCMDTSWLADGTEVNVPTDGYPPLLHVLAGLPSTVTSGLTGVYVMRLWMALITAALLAWAGTFMLKGGAWAFTGFLFAVTPMVMFVSSTVNPSGLTAGSASLLVAAWLSTIGVCRAPRSTLVALTIGALGLIATRRDGVFWLTALGAVALAHRGVSPHTWRSLVDRREMARWRAVAPTVAAIVVAAAFTVPWLWGFVQRQSSGAGSAWEGAKTLRFYFDQIIGYFGWLDTPMASEAVAVVYMAIGGLLFLGLSAANGPLRRSIIVAGLLMLVVPIVFAAVRFPYFQGRYMLPLWAATAMLAGTAVQRSTSRNLGPELLGGMWGVAHTWALMTNLKRYAVGSNGNWAQVFESDSWHPPMMSNMTALMAITLVGGGLTVTVITVLRRVDARG